MFDFNVPKTFNILLTFVSYRHEICGKTHYVKSLIFVQKVDFDISKIQPTPICRNLVTIISGFRWFFHAKNPVFDS